MTLVVASAARSPPAKLPDVTIAIRYSAVITYELTTTLPIVTNVGIPTITVYADA